MRFLCVAMPLSHSTTLANNHYKPFSPNSACGGFFGRTKRNLNTYNGNLRIISMFYELGHSVEQTSKEMPIVIQELVHPHKLSLSLSPHALPCNLACILFYVRWNVGAQIQEHEYHILIQCFASSTFEFALHALSIWSNLYTYDS